MAEPQQVAWPWKRTRYEVETMLEAATIEVAGQATTHTDAYYINLFLALLNNNHEVIVRGTASWDWLQKNGFSYIVESMFPAYHRLLKERHGLSFVRRERRVQIARGFGPTHDDTHSERELTLAAIAYAMPEPLYMMRSMKDQWMRHGFAMIDPWPWSQEDDKRRKYDDGQPAPHHTLPTINVVKLLIKAAAFLIAEIDRMMRKLTPLERSQIEIWMNEREEQLDISAGDNAEDMGA